MVHFMVEQLSENNTNNISVKLCNELSCTLEQIRKAKHKIASLSDKKPIVEQQIDIVKKELSHT